MAKVPVVADVFKYYLEQYGLDDKEDELASKTGIPKEKLLLWAKEDSEISISNLRKIADVYKKHWSMFLIKVRTASFKKPKDYRHRSRRNKEGLLTRLAYEEANRLIELNHEYRGSTISAELSALIGLNLSAGALAVKVRKTLGVDLALQSSWKSPDEVLQYYRKKIESLGVIVSEQELDDDHIDGFIVIKEEGVAIVLNRLIKSPYRRVTTLLHELGHYFQNESAACDTAELVHDTNNEQYAYDIASETLLPSSIFDYNEVVKSIASSGSSSEHDLSQISKAYGISMSAVAVKLHAKGLISRAARDNYLSTAEAIYKETEQKKKKKMKMKESKGFDPKGHERKAIQRVGQPLAKSLHDNYQAGKMSVRDFAGSMGTSINLVGRIENMLGNEWK